MRIGSSLMNVKRSGKRIFGWESFYRIKRFSQISLNQVSLKSF